MIDFVHESCFQSLIAQEGLLRLLVEFFLPLV